MKSAAPLSKHHDEAENRLVVADGRGNRLVLDVLAFRSNVLETRRLIGAHVRLFQVVKGEGYGLGLERVVALGISAGVDGFCAGTPEEALRIRTIDPKIFVLLFTASAPDALPELVAQGITVSVNSAEALEAIVQSGCSGQIYVELDCGFGRFGLDFASLDRVLDLYGAQSRIALTGVYTHFGQGDEEALDRGLARFDRAVGQLRQRIPTPFATMVASTHTILRRPRLAYDAVDPGRLLYGIVDALDDQARFRPVIATISSRIIQINRIAETQSMTIGYGESVTLPAGGATGVFPLGWYDGLSVRGGLGEVLVGGRRVRVLARTLLHSIVDLSTLDAAAIGDEVVVIGHQGGERLGLADAASAQGVSPTELHFKLAGSIAGSSSRPRRTEN
jgi:alanine racemase